ncbi:MAG: methyltransferase domain-containing protein [Rhodanobacteraceae bacterium]
MNEQASPCAAAQEIPAHFHRGAPLQAHQRRRHRAILAMLEGLEGSLLDYGCGWGDLTWAMSKQVGQACGVDVDPQRVAFAAQEYAPVTFSRCDAGSLAFPDQHFDIVTSVVVIPFVPDVDAYLEEVRRVLRPGGHLILAGRSMPWLNRLWRRMSGQGLSARSGLHVLTAAATQSRLEQHGFRVLRRSAFYDPPFSARRNLADVANSVVEFFGDMLGLVNVAPYPVFLARLES